MDTGEGFIKKAHFLRDKMNEQLNRKSIKYRWHEAKLTELEGVLARGDRKISKVIYDAYKAGCLYDSWSEFFYYDRWTKAFEDNNLEIEFYNCRERSEDEIFPWDFIDTGVTKDFLLREYKRATAEKVTPNCRQACMNCGVKHFGGGVCVEESTPQLKEAD
jgi:hypothetical protein